MKQTITLEDAIGGLALAITTRGGDTKQPRFETKSATVITRLAPGDINGTCRYNDPHSGGPSCIIGQALFHIDRDIFYKIAEFEGSAVPMLQELRNEHDIEISPMAVRLFKDTQYMADRGDEWTDAVQYGLGQLVYK